TYLSNEAKIRPFERNAAYTHYEYLCVEDHRTCETCRALSGQTFKISERNAGLNFPPMHPWCRCTVMPVVEDLEMIKSRLTSGGRSGTINVENPLKIDMQFFGNRNLQKMKSSQLIKSIKSWKHEIEEHKDKISHPDEHYPLWDTFDERQQNGYKKHWEKEIQTMQNDVEQAIIELKNRGDYDE
ncbi:MAG: minor capsid protein, partial [Ruminococcus callidus]|nr:minor capsid protein [Ruminococcus sp.]MDY6145618.1 minor capsid protein [Ruminococcus callidus]